MTDTSTAFAEALASFNDLRLGGSTLGALTAMGIETPTPIQAQALPALLAGRDVVGQARTGSGKTLAFGIPAVEIVDPRVRAVQALVLTPTRELAVQVAGVLRELGAEKGIEVVTIFGGAGVGPQRLALRRGAHIVVGTPGRVLDLLNQGALWLAKVRLLVLDEADEMLDYGFAPDVEKIIARTTPDRQTALFSATVPDWVRTTAAKHLNDPVTVAVAASPEDTSSIEHVAFDVPDGDKIGILKDLLSQPAEGQTIVFGRTKRGVARLARKLQGDGYPVVALQGDMAQGARDRVMAEFRAGAAPILVATNVAARGIDVTNVERVINVELPESPALLTHRIGRTGRMGRQGQAITLIGPEDGPKWRQLERGLTARIARLPWPGAEAAVAGGFEITEPTPQVAANGRRSTRGAQGVASPAPSAGGGRRLAPASTAGGGATERPAPRQPAQTGGEVVWRSSASQGTAASGPTKERSGGNDGRRQQDPAPVRVAAPSQSRGRRFPAPTGAPKVKAAMAARAAAGSWEAYESAGGASSAPTAVAEAAPTVVLCSGCGKSAQVPFDPDPSRPVYCASCFAERRGSRRPRQEREVLGAR